MNKQVIGHNSPGDPRRPTVPGVHQNQSPTAGTKRWAAVGRLLVVPPSLPCRPGTVVLWSVPGTALVSQLGKGQPGNMPWALEH